MTQPAKIYRYFDDYRTESFTCRSCGWTGPFDELEQEAWRELFDESCPSCGKMLVVVDFPTAEEIRDAASASNKEARTALAQVERRESLDARFDQLCMKALEELPDLDGDERRPTYRPLDGNHGFCAYVPVDNHRATNKGAANGTLRA